MKSWLRSNRMIEGGIRLHPPQCSLMQQRSRVHAQWRVNATKLTFNETWYWQCLYYIYILLFFSFQNFPTQSIPPSHVLILLTVKGFLIPPISLPLTQPQSNYHQLDVSSAPTCINLQLHRSLRIDYTSIHRNLLSAIPFPSRKLIYFLNDSC